MVANVFVIVTAENSDDVVLEKGGVLQRCCFVDCCVARTHVSTFFVVVAAAVAIVVAVAVIAAEICVFVTAFSRRFVNVGFGVWFES